MAEKTRINGDWTISVPDAICCRFNIKPGDVVEWCVDNGTVAVETSQEHGALDDFEPVAMIDTDNYSSYK